MKDKKQKTVVILEYLLMLSAVLYSSMWALFTDALSNTFSRVFIIILAALIVLSFKEISKKELFLVGALGAFILIFMIFTLYNPLRAVLYLFTPFCLSFLYLLILKKQQRLSKPFLYLSDIITVLSAVSLVLYVLGTLLSFIPPSSQVRFWWAEREQVANTYLHFLYEAQDITFFGKSFMRNCSIFPEAPGFAAFLGVSLAAELFLREKISHSRVIVLSLAAVTTFSAKALLLCALCYLLKFLFLNKSGALFAVLKSGAALLSAAFAAVILWDKAQSHSFYIRLDDFGAAIAAFVEHPIFGAGYYNDSAVIENFEYAYRFNDGLSMGLAVLLAEGGLWLFILYIASAVLAVLANKGQKRADILSFVVIFFSMLFITNMPFAMITIFTISYFLANAISLMKGAGMWQKSKA